MEFISIIKSNPLYPIFIFIIIAGFYYLLRISFSQRQNIKIAGRNIIVAFQPDLDTLIQNSNDCRLVLDSHVFSRHESAIRNNIKHLSFIQQIRLHRAWKELAYHPEDKDKKIPFYEMYADCGSLNKRAKMRPLAISRIQKIISIVK